MENTEEKFKKHFVLVDEETEQTIECYPVNIKEIPEFQSLISVSPVYMGNDTLFPDQQTTFFGMFDENMLYKGKMIDKEELIFDNGTFGDVNYYIVVHRIDFYNIRVHINSETVKEYKLDVVSNTWKEKENLN